MPHCSSMCWLCDLPVQADPYKGCSHGCVYCFARRFASEIGGDVDNGESAKALRSFIDGKRDDTTSFIDWNIPIRIGAMTDPFQPVERKKRRTYDMLKVLAETHYPCILTTKGEVVADDEYIQLLSRCNVLMQFTMACSEYDRLEPNAPSFEDRLKIMAKVSPHCTRTVVRIQPYLHQYFDSILASLQRFKDAGAYGVIVESMKWGSKHKGLVKVGGDYTYPLPVILKDFLELKEEAHRVGLKIYAGENRIRRYGDAISCCGNDGMEGFVPITYNMNHMIHDRKGMVCTEAMKRPETARAIAGRFDNDGTSKKSYKDAMDGFYRKHTKLVKDTFGIE